MHELFDFDIESFNIIAVSVVYHAVKLVKIPIWYRSANLNLATIFE